LYRQFVMSFGGMFDGAGSGVFSYDAGGGAGMHNPGPPIPQPGGGFASPGLSLGLVGFLLSSHSCIVGFPDPLICCVLIWCARFIFFFGFSKRTWTEGS
jgi:hypothetical protein